MTTTSCVFQKGDIVKGVGEPYASWGHGRVSRVAPREVFNTKTGQTTVYPDEPIVWVRWEGDSWDSSTMPENLRLVARPGSSAE